MWAASDMMATLWLRFQGSGSSRQVEAAVLARQHSSTAAAHLLSRVPPHHPLRNTPLGDVAANHLHDHEHKAQRTCYYQLALHLQGGQRWAGQPALLATVFMTTVGHRCTHAARQTHLAVGLRAGSGPGGQEALVLELALCRQAGGQRQRERRTAQCRCSEEQRLARSVARPAANWQLLSCPCPPSPDMTGFMPPPSCVLSSPPSAAAPLAASSSGVRLSSAGCDMAITHREAVHAGWCVLGMQPTSEQQGC
jgi:hypothetical protein